MSARLLDGKKLAEKILTEIKNQVANMETIPGLAAILVGDNEASKLYLKLKEKACLKTGINFHSYFLPSNCSEKQILEVINFLNIDPETLGIIVQLPLPPKFNKDEIIAAISSEKDVDGFGPNSPYTSPNALGIIELLKLTNINLKDKKVTILANSNKFALSFKKLLPDCKINIRPEFTKDADILIVALGKPYYIKPDMIKKNAILIDVGINKINGKIVGDIDPGCDQVAAWRSPVPGGVGPMTVAMLLQNLVKMAR